MHTIKFYLYITLKRDKLILIKNDQAEIEIADEKFLLGIVDFF